MTAEEALTMPADPYEATYMWRVCSEDGYEIVWMLVDPLTRNLLYVSSTPDDLLFIRASLASNIDMLQQNALRRKLKPDDICYTKADWHYGTRGELLQWLQVVLEDPK